MKCRKQIILGSASPRRRELLQQIGLEFTVITSDCEEHITKTIPAEVVQELSLMKAMDVFSKVNNTEALVIGADTIVALEGTILGKPHSKENAISMLNHLQGKIHQVYTSVSLVWEEKGEVHTHTFYECTDVEVLPMTEEEIAYYVNLDTCMDKAGAYGIQNEFACYVKGIKGDYNNVVGLPIGRVYQELKQFSLLIL
jgi:septum formation protein